MNALDRITKVLRDARVGGGWLDENVAAKVLLTLGLDDDGHAIPISYREPRDQSGEPDDRVHDAWPNRV